MNSSLDQIIFKIQEHQQLQELKLENNSSGKKRLLSFFSALGRTHDLCETLLPYIQKCFVRQKIQQLTTVIAATLLCIFIILLLIGIFLAA
ncbi:MAG: hypothetical protein SO016_09495 [Lachnospiraceae bacterium]|nr:hypothetical protein [Robinsoniella sp.]MDY3766905.1 hypothetical protein [Lachnospiraceae bacterium]